MIVVNSQLWRTPIPFYSQIIYFTLLQHLAAKRETNHNDVLKQLVVIHIRTCIIVNTLAKNTIVASKYCVIVCPWCTHGLNLGSVQRMDRRIHSAAVRTDPYTLTAA